jgi:hypothetical protein
LATLAAASFLNEAGNSAGLNIAEPGRAPDLRVQMSADEYVGCEVKTPQAPERCWPGLIWKRRKRVRRFAAVFSPASRSATR